MNRNHGVPIAARIVPTRSDRRYLKKVVEGNHRSFHLKSGVCCNCILMCSIVHLPIMFTLGQLTVKQHCHTAGNLKESDYCGRGTRERRVSRASELVVVQDSGATRNCSHREFFLTMAQMDHGNLS